MDSRIITGILCAVCGMAQMTPPVMPDWVKPYPGVMPNLLIRPALAEMSYTTQASSEQVLDFLHEQFTAAGLPFSPSDNGMGVSARATAPECDLLVRVSQRISVTAVTISCTSVLPRLASAAGDVTVNQGSPRGSLPRRPLPDSVAERIRASEQRSKEYVASLNAQSRERESKMSRYDKPVTRKEQEPFYHNDAPPLVWPAWLVHFGSNSTPKPVPGTDESKLSYLESRYQTNAPMSELYQNYRDLLEANGFPVATAKLATGHTLGGTMQNADGYVEGTQHQGDKAVNSPSTVINVSFNRSVLNGPITVRLRVTAKGSFGRYGNQ